MAGVRFDILFAGKLMGGADPERVRSQLQQQFKLSEAAAERLFSGRTITIKRGVDAATASRYRKLFRDAEALIEIRPVDAPPSEIPSVSDSEPTRESSLESRLDPADSEPLEPTNSVPGSLLSDPSESQRYAPQGEPHTDGPQAVDLSHLSLVPGNDWTLEDCQPPPPPVSPPDISHLEIVPPEADPDTEQNN